jgi:hypothetical protein
MITVGLLELRVPDKSRQLRLRHPEQTERGIKRHKVWLAAGTTQDSIEGNRHPEAMYLSPGQEISFTPLRVG